MMIRRSISIALVSVLAGALGLFTFAAPISQTTGTWHLLGSLVDARQGASATMLDDGRVLVAGGSNASGLLASAEVVSADGSSVAVAAMSVARSGHTATKLMDGRVLVTGGTGAGGAATASAEIFTPWSGTWTSVSMTVARRNHTATLIKGDSGLVVIAGGDNAGGVLSSVEVFDPAAGAFAPLAVAMSSARTRHAAAPLPDGQVIVIGGSNGPSVAGTTDIVNALTGAVFAGPSMTDARMNFTATDLLNGDVLVAGGVGGANGTTELAAAEKLVVATGVFISANGLPGPRQGHQAVRLPSNAGVLVVGGTAYGQPLRTVDLFLPESQVFRMTSPTDLEHTAGTLAPVGTGLALSAGGTGTAAMETYAFATVTTDYEDYAPGSIVTMTGTGWTPNEPVTLVLREELGAHPPRTFTAMANGLGNFTNSEFSPEEHHIGVRFFLTATQGASEAQHTFLDGVTNLAITSPTTASPVSIASGDLPEPATVAFNYTTNGSGGTITATANVKNGATVIASNSKTIARANGGGGASESVVVTIPTGTVAGSYTVEVIVANPPPGSGNPPSMTATQSAAVVITGGGATTTSIDAPTIVYDANGTVTVTVTGSSTPTGTVTLAVDGGSAVGKALTSGSATFTSAEIPALASPTAGNHSLSASYAAQDGFQASSATGALLVDKATSTTTVTCPASVTYTGAARTPCSVTVTGAGGLSLTPAPTYSNNTNAGTATASYNFAGDANHEISADTENFTIDKAQPVCTIAGYNVTYDGNSHTATGSCVGVLGETLAGLSLTGTTHTNAGEYPNDPWSFVDDTGNYHDKNGTVADAIAKASSTTTVTCTAGPFTYTGSPQTPCSVSVTGAGGLNLTPAPVYANNTNAGPATASYTFTGDTNHDGSNDSENFTIDKASSTTTVTCTGGPFVYNGSAFEPCSVSVTGAGGLNLTPTPVYANNTDAGAATASYTFTGDMNHDGSNDSENFTIDKASSTTTVTCAAGPFVYNGSAHEPCSVGVTGAGGLNLTPAPVYANNTDAGLATASYTYPGDTNHETSSDSENFTITKASSTTTVTCTAGPFVYTGSPYTPCSVTVTGAGGLNLAPTPDYANNTDAGLATASYTYPGDTNHETSSDSENFTITKASSTTTVTCTAGPFVYTGSPSTPCSVSVTGAGGLNLTPAPDYANNTDAGLATASYTYPGDTNHETSSDSENFTITKASSTTTVTCTAGPFVYTGSPYTPCSVTVTGAGGLNLAPTPDYANNTDAGLATASYTYPGDTNHETSSDSENFTITKASSTTTVTCTAGPFVYTGSPYTPCSVSVTGAGGLNETPAPVYTNNTDAGLATASYTYPGDTNHETSSDSEDFTIAKASSTTTVTCTAGPFVYTGSPYTPCSVSVTGAGGLNLTPAPDYANNTDAGLATASYTFPGDTNHETSSDSENFTIAKASSTTTVTCPANVTYTGSALTPCTVSVTGAGSLNLTPTPAYVNNTNAGLATASYTFTGDANHDGSNDSQNFTIDKAASTTTVTCGAGPFTYNGNAQTPCSATVTGANLNLTSLTPSYADNTNAGTATASYAYGGDPNHTPSSDSETFEIGKASASVAAQNKSKVFGATMTPDQSAPGDFNVTGIFAGDAVSTITLASPGYAAAAAPGSHTITPSNATGTGLSNYNIAYTNATLSVTYAYGMCQGSPGRTILNPINPDGSSVFKQKSTVPAKFRVCDANGNSVGLPGTVTGFAMILSSSGTYSDANEAPDSTTPDTAFRWSATDQQWIFNISTKSMAANKTYLFRISLADGTFIDFAFGLK